MKEETDNESSMCNLNLWHFECYIYKSINIIDHSTQVKAVEVYEKERVKSLDLLSFKT